MKESKKAEQTPGDEFYEAMPLAAPLAGSHYVYRDDVMEEPVVSPREERFTAIVTLVLVAFVVIVVALIFSRGLAIMRDASDSNAATSTSIDF